MTAPALDVRDHMTTLLGLVDDALGQWSAFRYGELDGKTLPHIFALVTVERMYVEPERNGRTRRSGWRAQVQYVGRTALEAEWAASKVMQALDQVRLTIDGHTSTAVKFEPIRPISSDAGRFSGESAYTYAL